jgi:hypothetical protein
MKQLVIEWLYDQIENKGKCMYEVFDQAKEMEKEQIVNAFEIGYDNGACVQEGSAIYHGSNYYNETFKSE